MVPSHYLNQWWLINLTIILILGKQGISIVKWLPNNIFVDNFMQFTETMTTAPSHMPAKGCVALGYKNQPARCALNFVEEIF